MTRWITECAASLQGGQAFQPPLWLRGGHLQTLVASQARREWPVAGQRRWQLVRLGDGAQVRILHVQESSPGPTLVLLHGMGGSTDSGYIRGFSEKALRSGWNVAAANLYNVNPDLGFPRIFHAGCSSDFAEILQRSGLLDRSLVLIGVSLGGNILLKMLGEWGAAPPHSIRAAAALSPLVDLKESWPLLDQSSSWVYRRHFVRRLSDLVRRHEEHLHGFVDLDRLRSVRTIRGYDEVITAPLGGFSSVDDYYRRASARPLLGQIRVPTMVIHASDDPLLPAGPWNDRSVIENSRLGVSLQSHGGHVGFLQRRQPDDPDRWWAENRIIDFLQTALSR